MGIGANAMWQSASTPAYLNLSTSGSLTAGDYILVHLTGDNMSNVGHVEGMNWIGGEGVSGLGAKDSLKWRTNADGTLDLVWTIGSDIVSLVRPATTLTWSGGEGVWAVKAGGDANVWTGSVEDLNFYDGDTVEFNSAATVTVEGNVAPAAIVVSNADGTVTIEGAGQIQGAGKLTKTGNGTLALNTRNAYTGGTELNGGTIEVGDSYALGLGEVQLKSGKLDLGGCGVGNTIKATGGTLAGAGDYAGMLLVNGELALEGDVSAAGGVGLVSGKISGGSIKDSLIAADGGELASTIIGSSSVTAQEGKVTISGDNSYSGGTTISGAELTVKHANALGSGAISATGTSSLIVDGVTLAPAKAISNSGTLTISGKFDGSALSKVAADDVRIDDLGVENATSGFLRTGNYTVTLVEGGTVNSSAATLEYKGKTLSLNGGVGYAAGTVDYSTYLLTGSDSATVSKIAAAAGTSLTCIDMQGGALTVDENTELITATGGSIELTGGIMGGSIGGSTVVTVSGDASISGANTYTGGTNIAGAELTMTHASALGEGTIAVTGTSSLIVGTGVTLVLTDSIMNTDSLSLSGNFNIDALEPSGEVPSVRVDLTGTEGESGFLKTAGYNLQVVQGGLVNDDSAVISHNGKTVELNDAGVAVIEGGINYTQYHIASGHIAGVTDIVAAATAEGVTLSGISLAEGGTLNADATIEVKADGGTISLTAGTLSGTLKDVQVQASAGDIAATFSGEKSALVGSNFVMGSNALQNEGRLALSGSYVADALNSVLTNVDVRVDENGTAGGGSGFLRTGDFTVTLIEGGTVDSSAAEVQYKGQQLAMTGGVGFGVGTVDYSTYLLTGSDTATVSKIAAAAGGALSGIDMQGGTLTVDESTELITATGGNIELTAGVMGGSIGGSTVVTVRGDATISGDNSYTGGTTISGAALTMTHDNAPGSGPIAVIGASSLIIADGACLKLTQTITNSDSLTLSGAVNIDALASTGEIPSVRVDLSGAEGESGFLKTGSYNVQVVQGGTVNAESAVISRNGVTVSLDEAGVAFIEGRTDYSQYHVGAGHEVDVQSVIAKSSAEGASLQDMSLTGGGTLNVNTSMAVMADGGTINLSSGILSGSLGGGTVVSVTGIGTISGAHQYEGGTSLTDAALTVAHAESLGTGSIASSGTSSLTVADGAALALRHVITQADDGELTITGGVNADALALERTSSDKRVNLDGEEVAGSLSGFDKDVKYSVQIVEGGKTLGSAAVVKHADYTGPAVLVLGEDGLASTGTIDVDYSDYFLTNGDSANAGDILAEAGKNQTEFDEVHLDDGKLVVDADVTVDSEGGEIELESGNTLSGELKDTTIVVLPGDEASRIEADISGESSVVVSGGSTTISGNSSFEGGTSVSDEGELIVENASALGNGDVDVASSIIDLTAAEGVKNTVSLSGTSTVRGADNARYFELMKGSVTSFEGGFVLDEGKTLAVRNARAATFALRSLRSGDITLYKGALTLAGGTLSLDSMLKVEGKVTFMAGRRTLVDISGWEGAGEGTTLADFGTDNEGYTKGCLTLSGIAGRYELLFDEATGLLTLGLIPEEEKPVITPEDLPEPEKLPELTSNQKAVYEALSDMIEDADLEGELRDIVQSTLESGDAEAITAMLEQLSGAEYAVVMGSQIDGNTAHLSYLRRMAGSGWELVGNSYTRAYVEMYTNDSNVNGDAHGRGYDRTEMGGQFALEFIGCKHMSSGIAVAAGRTRLQADGALRVHSENVYADAYTMYRSDNGYNALFSAGVGIHEHDLARHVSGHRTKANADGLSFNFMHESSVDMKINETNKVQLFAAVESSWNDIESFREKGAGSASLECDDQQAWATDITLGARYIHRFVAFHYGPAASLTLEAGVIASVGDISSDADMHFAGADDKEFSVRSAKRNRWGYNVGASFHLPMSPFSAVQLGGEATLRGDSCDWNVNAGVQIAF
ncbi:MAG: autotransporter-associated beta strand repeat-containing protein [Akkermansia sp.]|nr:autotransporter-associated beta strand repeat-containing protein [Akkermansia sp.]